MKTSISKILIISVLWNSPVFAQTKHILANTDLLKSLGIKTLLSGPQSGVSYARISPQQEALILETTHREGRCGGFQLLEESHSPMSLSSVGSEIENLEQWHTLNKIQEIQSTLAGDFELSPQPSIRNALDIVDSERLGHWIKWFSSFNNRYHKEPKINDFVKELRLGLQSIISHTRQNVAITEISHKNTKQNSIRVRIFGSEKPNEVVVVGAHLDSILGWGQIGARAPGADDNASGSSNVIEILIGLVNSGWRPKRTIDLFWYAGEEGGLIGSTEIAKDYKKNKIDVVAALQLDMTLFPGSGEFSITSIEDFTHPGLRNYLEKIASAYTRIKIIPGDKCGYACSDHASWTSQGYASVFPFEAMSASSNFDLHTLNDTLNDKSSLLHSAEFAKLGLAFVMEISNSEYRP